MHRAYPAALRDALVRTDELTAPRIAELSFTLARRYAAAVRALSRWGVPSVVGMHGQTIWHAPPPRRTPARCRSALRRRWRNGWGCRWSAICGAPTWRSAVKGAPIVPFAHWFFTPRRDTPRLVVNFGGICNFTYVPEREPKCWRTTWGPA